MRSLLPLFILAFASTAPALASEVVPLPSFDSVQLRGGGQVTVVPAARQRVTIVEGSSRITRMHVDHNGQLRIDVCNGNCPRNYHLRVQIESPTVPDLAIAGGGLVTAQGGFRAQGQLSVAVNGGGKIDARAVEAHVVSAAVNGGGQLLVHPSASLSAAVNGGGLVQYWGHPTSVTQAVHGGGAVTPAS